MTNINVNSVVYLKTSEEPVFVLALIGDVALVRRPVQGDRGVAHSIETFGIEELETKEDKTVGDAKFLKFQLNVRDQVAKERQADKTVSKEAVSDTPPEGYQN